MIIVPATHSFSLHAIKILEQLFTALLAILICCATPVSAQETTRIFKIGVLVPSAPVPHFSQLYVKTLRDLGYVEGRNLIYTERWAEGSEERLRRYAAELVSSKVDVIFAATATGVRAAVNATKTIPIVAIDMESDPVANGWVATLTRPGGNVTGFFLDLPELSGKRLEQLREIVPGLSKLAVLWDGTQDRTPLEATERSAASAGLRVVTVEVRRPEDFQSAFRRAVKERVQAILMWGSPMFDGNAATLADLSLQHHLPIAGFFPFHPESGFLISYGPDIDDVVRRAHGYADRILKGEKPSELPAQRPTKFYLVLNMKTAKVLRVTFPQSLLLQADRVIK